MASESMNIITSKKSMMIKLVSSEGQVFEVEDGVAFKSGLIKDMMDDMGCNDVSIPLLNVKAGILAKVIEFYKGLPTNNNAAGSSTNYTHDYVNDPAKTAFNAQFLKSLKPDELFDIILAANYLNMPELLNTGCQAVADLIKNKNVEELRTIFGIVNDFSPEEEAEVRREKAWAFE